MTPRGRAGARLAAVVAAALSGAPACGRLPAALDARGPGAADIAGLFWLFLALTVVPGAATIAVLLLAVRGKRRRRTLADVRPGDGHGWIVAGTLVTAGVLAALLVASVRAGSRAAAPSGPAELTIDVRGHQFWWEVRYPDHQVVTANEVHIPVGRPVRLRLSSADVIHSFWVPELHGKRDMIPGETNVLWVQADRAGVYRGSCAEFCGVQHALMAFELVAEPPGALAAWLRARRAPSAPPSDDHGRRGLEVYVAAGCAHCHAIQGVVPPSATGSVGPDLTHVASRRTLAAATLPNNRGYLAGWVLNPQHHKPGSRMPPVTLAPDSLMALLDYLEGLR
ncbi:cytochrome c oxidase subunit II [Sorangium sp. So ce542]|uniref:cytochrome c oxidase subunit II n=1 Tax=Sorangium sp. So ce542 TaxID=3133316 RepID=UPI003F5E6824